MHLKKTKLPLCPGGGGGALNKFNTIQVVTGCVYCLILDLQAHPREFCMINISSSKAQFQLA